MVTASEVTTEAASIPSVDPAVVELVRRVEPDATILRVAPFAPDAPVTDGTLKAAGYGAPIRIDLTSPRGPRTLVLHTATANDFGHDRRADRAAEIVLAGDTFCTVPGHVAAVEVGAFRRDGGLVSLADTGEFYLLTEYAPGRVYADELREVARRGASTARDAERARALARHLARMHREVVEPRAYVRSVRDVVGSGEGIFGIVDGYPPGTPGASSSRLEAIERRCVHWRWRLRERAARARRIHGDFHPFNVVLDDSNGVRLLDASRGSAGEPADDLTAMSVNYVFFALASGNSWWSAFRELWRSFWGTYLDETGDDAVLDAAPVFFAWRALVLCNPVWYPDVSEDARDGLLGIAEDALEDGRLDLEAPDDAFP